MARAGRAHGQGSPGVRTRAFRSVCRTGRVWPRARLPFAAVLVIAACGEQKYNLPRDRARRVDREPRGQVVALQMEGAKDPGGGGGALGWVAASHEHVSRRVAGAATGARLYESGAAAERKRHERAVLRRARERGLGRRWWGAAHSDRFLRDDQRRVGAHVGGVEVEENVK